MKRWVWPWIIERLVFLLSMVWLNPRPTPYSAWSPSRVWALLRHAWFPRKQGLTSLSIDRFLKKGLTTSISVWIYCQIVVKMASERIVTAGLFVFIFCLAFSSTAGRFVQFLTWFRMVFNLKWEKIGLSLPALCEKSHCNFTQKRVCFIRITWWNTHWRKHCRGLQFSRKSWCRSQGRILVSRNIWTFSV